MGRNDRRANPAASLIGDAPIWPSGLHYRALRQIAGDAFLRILCGGNLRM
jgi:hypothetical protein